MGKGFFVIIFEEEADFVKVTAGGPWLIGGFPLFLKLCESGFKPSQASINSALV